MVQDRTIIATAVPQITDDFNSLGDVGWYGSAYLLTSCATQLLFGRIYTFYSVKWVFLTAIALFEIGSAVCGAAPNSLAFIMGRAIAGLGSAGVYSGVIVIMVPIVPLAKRPLYQGAFGAIFGVSSVMGPLVGGAFTKAATWRWCFYLNLPIGALSMLIILLILHIPPPATEATGIRRKIEQLDPIGNLFFLPAIVCLLLALQWGGSTYAWNNGRIIALLVLFVILGAAWLYIQTWKGDEATVPIRILTHRSIASGFYFSMCIGAVMMTWVYYLPIWFQAIKGVDAVESGIRVLPFVLSLVVGSILSGGIVAKIGYYTPAMIVSAIFTSVGAGLITTFKVDTPQPTWIGYQVIVGFGIGCAMQQAGLAAQRVLKDTDVPIGISMMFFAQALGGTVFLCAAQNIFNNNLIANLASVAGLDPSIILNSGATDFRKFVRPEELGAVLVAYNSALTTTYRIAIAASCLSVVGALTMEWKSIKGMKGGRGKVDKSDKA